MKLLLQQLQEILKTLQDQQKQAQFIQAGNGNQQIKTQNNFNALYTFTPISIDALNGQKLQVYKFNNTDIPDILGILFISFILGFSWLLFLEFTTNFSIPFFDNIFRILIFSMMIFIFLLFLSLLGKYRPKLNLEIEENQINIGELDKNGQYIANKFYNTIFYQDIRSFYKEKSLIGYSFHIYKINQLMPSFRFNTESIHIANSVEELLLSKIANQFFKEEIQQEL